MWMRAAVVVAVLVLVSAKDCHDEEGNVEMNDRKIDARYYQLVSSGGNGDKRDVIDIIGIGKRSGKGKMAKQNKGALEKILYLKKRNAEETPTEDEVEMIADDSLFSKYIHTVYVPKNKKLNRNQAKYYRFGLSLGKRSGNAVASDEKGVVEKEQEVEMVPDDSIFSKYIHTVYVPKNKKYNRNQAKYYRFGLTLGKRSGNTMEMPADETLVTPNTRTTTETAPTTESAKEGVEMVKDDSLFSKYIYTIYVPKKTKSYKGRDYRLSIGLGKRSGGNSHIRPPPTIRSLKSNPQAAFILQKQ
uniref:SERPIN domain-containing protein n=1 Tax=Rhabditophanes sp. KR3021 TaxID=114890 RepID=A0AC35TKW1_9BILA